MTDDRIELTALNLQIKQLEMSAKKLTTHPCGKLYGKLIQYLIYKYIDPNFTDLQHYGMTPEIHKKYCILHKEISDVTNTKTQVFTKSEYQIALNYMKTKWNYIIPKEYEV